MTIALDRPSVAEAAIPVDHFVRGRLVPGGAVRYRSRDLGADFATPEIELSDVARPRSEPVPLYDVPLREVVELLVETGKRLDLDANGYLQDALERVVVTNPLPRRVVENMFRSAGSYLDGTLLMETVRANFPDPSVLDGWVERTDARGQRGAVRACPPRLVHMLAGNAPTGCVSSIAQGAIVKAVNLFKMPSSDPFTCVAVLRTMADLAPDHPLVRSMSAIYWRGGDDRVERTLYRPQYFDRIVAWGGGDAIDNVIKHLGPGLQLLSFDPKTSISLIGPEGFASDGAIADVAERTAQDVMIYNQAACLASRFVFVAGDREGIERFCARLQERLGIDRDFGSAEAPPLPAELREEIDVMALIGGDTYRTWGKGDGRGLVILTDEPVAFHPSGKTVNVVRLASIGDVAAHVTVATQTIGIHPDALKHAMRDRLAAAGAQRVVRLGSAAGFVLGSPHDAMYPLNRLVHWMSDESA